MSDTKRSARKLDGKIYYISGEGEDARIIGSFPYPEYGWAYEELADRWINNGKAKL